MNILEINLINPIGYYEINQLILEIQNSNKNEYLIINTGKHDFISVGVIKYFREQLQTLRTQLLNFNKIALIHPPDYENKSSEPDFYNYFKSVDDAKDWFLQKD